MSTHSEQARPPRLCDRRKFEAGIVLQGWEVKSVRASRAQINLAHIYVRDGSSSSATPT